LRASDTRRLSSDELADAARILSPEQYAAEFECDPSAAIQGAYFGKELAPKEELPKPLFKGMDDLTMGDWIRLKSLRFAVASKNWRRPISD
jgi:hypothetical protein